MASNSQDFLQQIIQVIKQEFASLKTDFASLESKYETIQGDQQRLNVAINRLQSQTLASGEPSYLKTEAAIPLARPIPRVHKRRFPEYDGQDDMLP